MLAPKKAGDKHSGGRKKHGARAPRDPERTRRLLLHTAFAEIYRSGFQGTGLERILRRAKVTKGALYHHFASKEELGYAMVDEVIGKISYEKWERPLGEDGNPLDRLIEMVRKTSLKPEHVIGGCPVNNLAQEMSPLDEGMRTRLAKQFSNWNKAIARALQRGQKRGEVRADIDPKGAATFFIAAYEGYMSLAKNAQDPEVLRKGLLALERHLETLRAKG